jgi:hypothetical protein
LWLPTTANDLNRYAFNGYRNRLKKLPWWRGCCVVDGLLEPIGRSNTSRLGMFSDVNKAIKKRKKNQVLCRFGTAAAPFTRVATTVSYEMRIEGRLESEN